MIACLGWIDWPAPRRCPINPPATQENAPAATDHNIIIIKQEMLEPQPAGIFVMKSSQNKLSPAKPVRWRETPRARMAIGLIALIVIGTMVWFTGRSLLDGYRLEKGRALLAENRAEEAWSWLASLQPTLCGSAEVAFLGAQAARRTRQTGLARSCLRNARAQGWPPEAVDLEMALVDVQTGQPEPHLEKLLSSLEVDYPERPRVLEALVPALFVQFDLNRAQFCATQWTELEPDNPLAWVWLGRVEDKLQNRPPAEAAFARALEVAPNNPDALAWMARQLQRRHQPEEAIQILNRLAVLTPARPDIPLIQGRCFRDLDREDEARSSLQEAIRRTPQGSEAWLELGRLELNANHPAEAEKNFTQALRWSPADREVLFNLAQALERLGKKQEADTVRNRQAQVEKDLRNTSDAAEKIRGNPRDPAPRVEIAEMMLRNGLTQEGGRWLESALAIDPKNERALALAKTYGLK